MSPYVRAAQFVFIKRMDTQNISPRENRAIGGRFVVTNFKKMYHNRMRTDLVMNASNRIFYIN